MKPEWSLVTIESIQENKKGSIAIGPFGSRMKSDCYVNEGIPVIRGTNINDGSSFSGELFTSVNEKADTLGSSNVFRDDHVFPHRGSIGEVGIKSGSISTCDLPCCMQRFLLIANKGCTQVFVLRFQESSRFIELLKNASQVGTPGIGQPLTSLKTAF